MDYYKKIKNVIENKTIIDDTIKNKHHNKTLGLIISKKNDNFIFKYVNDDGIYVIRYEIYNKR